MNLRVTSYLGLRINNTHIRVCRNLGYWSSIMWVSCGNTGSVI